MSFKTVKDSIVLQSLGIEMVNTTIMLLINIILTNKNSLKLRYSSKLATTTKIMIYVWIILDEII